MFHSAPLNYLLASGFLVNELLLNRMKAIIDTLFTNSTLALER